MYEKISPSPKNIYHIFIDLKTTFDIVWNVALGNHERVKRRLKHYAHQAITDCIDQNCNASEQYHMWVIVQHMGQSDLPGISVFSQHWTTSSCHDTGHTQWLYIIITTTSSDSMSLTCSLVYWLTGWLTDWLTGWLAGWLTQSCTHTHSSMQSHFDWDTCGVAHLDVLSHQGMPMNSEKNHSWRIATQMT